MDEEDEEFEEDEMPMDVWTNLFMRPFDISKIKFWEDENN